MTQVCLACNGLLEDYAKECMLCGFENISRISWISDSLKNKLAITRKPIRQILSVDHLKSLAEKATSQCGIHPYSLSIKIIENQFLDMFHTNDPSDLEIYCHLKRLRCYSDDQLLALLREQIMFAKTFDKGAPFTPISGVMEQQLEYRLKLKLGYDASVVSGQYSKLFPNDQYLYSSKIILLPSFSAKYHMTKYLISNSKDMPFLQSANVAIDLYRDVSYFLFEAKQQLEDWVYETNCQALHTFWKWLHEDFCFIEQNTSGRGETEKLLQLTEFMSSSIFYSLIYDSNKIEFLSTFDQNMQTCDHNTTNPIGKAIIKSWKTRFNNNPYAFS